MLDSGTHAARLRNVSPKADMVRERVALQTIRAAPRLSSDLSTATYAAANIEPRAKRNHDNLQVRVVLDLGTVLRPLSFKS